VSLIIVADGRAVRGVRNVRRVAQRGVRQARRADQRGQQGDDFGAGLRGRLAGGRQIQRDVGLAAARHGQHAAGDRDARQVAVGGGLHGRVEAVDGCGVQAGVAGERLQQGDDLRARERRAATALAGRQVDDDVGAVATRDGQHAAVQRDARQVAVGGGGGQVAQRRGAQPVGAGPRGQQGDDFGARLVSRRASLDAGQFGAVGRREDVVARGGQQQGEFAALPRDGGGNNFRAVRVGAARHGRRGRVDALVSH